MHIDYGIIFRREEEYWSFNVQNFSSAGNQLAVLLIRAVAKLFKGESFVQISAGFYLSKSSQKVNSVSLFKRLERIIVKLILLSDVSSKTSIIESPHSLFESSKILSKAKRIANAHPSLNY